jgi:hypothetical protein
MSLGSMETIQLICCLGRTSNHPSTHTMLFSVTTDIFLSLSISLFPSVEVLPGQEVSFTFLNSGTYRFFLSLVNNNLQVRKGPLKGKKGKENTGNGSGNGNGFLLTGQVIVIGKYLNNECMLFFWIYQLVSFLGPTGTSAPVETSEAPAKPGKKTYKQVRSKRLLFYSPFFWITHISPLRTVGQATTGSKVLLLVGLVATSVAAITFFIIWRRIRTATTTVNERTPLL